MRLGSTSGERFYSPAPLVAHVEGLTIREAAARLGTSPRQVVRWRSGVGLRARTADAVAIHIGSHPELLWPGFLDLVGGEDGDDAALGDPG